MDSLSKEDVAFGLKVVATLSTGFFSGGCAFAGFDALPAFMTLDGPNSLKAMKEMLTNSSPMPITIVVGAASAAGAYFLTRGTSKEDAGWLAGAALFGAVLPYTGMVIVPMNSRVWKDEVPPSEAPSLMKHWLNMHWIRTAVTLGLFGYFTYKLAQ